MPAGASIAAEHWDDSVPTGALAQGYTFVTVPVFEPDDQTKLRKLFVRARGRLLRGQLTTRLTGPWGGCPTGTR